MVCGVGRSWLGTKKPVLMTKNKPEGISFMSLETGNQLWFSAAFSQEMSGEAPAAWGQVTRGPVGLQRDRCYIHPSSVYAWSPVTREATRCNASVSDTEI